MTPSDAWPTTLPSRGMSVRRLLAHHVGIYDVHVGRDLPTQ
ncbi:hypothetical protein [Paraconexibacter antarcticus]|nr:hypothetical protein [Paraconexibacter antarcticus]